MHVSLHLNPVLKLGLLHSALLKLVKRLFAVSFDLKHMALFWRFRHSGFNDSVNAAADMAAEVHAGLRSASVAHVNTDGSKIADDGCFLILPSAEHSQDAARKGGLHSPAERQPKPAFARVSQLAASHVRARRFGAFLVRRVNQRGNAVCLIFWNCGHFSSLCVL